MSSEKKAHQQPLQIASEQKFLCLLPKSQCSLQLDNANYIIKCSRSEENAWQLTVTDSYFEKAKIQISEQKYILCQPSQTAELYGLYSWAMQPIGTHVWHLKNKTVEIFSTCHKFFCLWFSILCFLQAVNYSFATVPL